MQWRLKPAKRDGVATASRTAAEVVDEMSMKGPVVLAGDFPQSTTDRIMGDSFGLLDDDAALLVAMGDMLFSFRDASLVSEKPKDGWDNSSLDDEGFVGDVASLYVDCIVARYTSIDISATGLKSPFVAVKSTSFDSINADLVLDDKSVNTGSVKMLEVNAGCVTVKDLENIEGVASDRRTIANVFSKRDASQEQVVGSGSDKGGSFGRVVVNGNLDQSLGSEPIPLPILNQQEAGTEMKTSASGAELHKGTDSDFDEEFICDDVHGCDTLSPSSVPVDSQPCGSVGEGVPNVVGNLCYEGYNQKIASTGSEVALTPEKEDKSPEEGLCIHVVDCRDASGKFVEKNPSQTSIATELIFKTGKGNYKHVAGCSKVHDSKKKH